MPAHLASIFLLAALSLFLVPVAGFEPGEITSLDELNGFVWRHGDIATAVLLELPISFRTNYAFTKLEKMNVYFGNWIRDLSKFIDVAVLKQVDEALVRALVRTSL